MKLENSILLVAATLVTALYLNTATAQSSGVGKDGIAASPKVRQQIDDQNRSKAAAVANTQSHSCCQTVSVTPSCKTGCCTK